MSSESPPITLYLHHDGRQLGPFSAEQARAMVAAGSLPPDVPAWTEGMTAWVPLSDLLPPVETSPAPASPADGFSSPPEASFFPSLIWAFVYPFQKDGLILLGSGAVFFWLVGRFSGHGGVISYGGVMSWALALFATGYLAAYLQSIVQSSARGDEELPSWPDFTDLQDDILLPCLRFFAPCVLCLGPGLALKIARTGLGPDEVGSVPAWGPWALLIAGALYLPMALLAVAMADRLPAMSPTVVIPSIVRVAGEYAAVCGVLALAVGLSFALDRWQPALPRIPVVSTLAEGLMGCFWTLYWLTAAMRVLGLLYHHTNRRLAWF